MALQLAPACQESHREVPAIAQDVDYDRGVEVTTPWQP